MSLDVSLGKGYMIELDVVNLYSTLEARLLLWRIGGWMLVF